MLVDFKGIAHSAYGGHFPVLVGVADHAHGAKPTVGAVRTFGEIFFAHPYRSGERSTNENSNGIIRRFFPKGTDFSKVSDEDIAKTQNWMTVIPEKSLTVYRL
jgi:hypothetical protein